MNGTKPSQQQKPTPPSEHFLKEIAPWIQGRNCSLYLTGRQKPLTECVVKHVGRATIVARWNASTHLIPADKIEYIRFGPDAEPVRDITHPLHTTMTTRMQYTHAPTPATDERSSAPCRRSSNNEPAAAQSDALTPAAIMPRILGALASAAAISTASPTNPTDSPKR